MTTMINQSVVERHAEDLAFFWSQRERALESSCFAHRDLARLDDRVDAHLDGLRVAGEAGLACCHEAMSVWGESKELFASAAVALDRLADDPTGTVWLDAVLERVEIDDGPGRRALCAAIGWQPFERVQTLLQRWLDSREPLLGHLAIAGHAIHRRGEGLDEALQVGLQGSSRVHQARCARAAGELGRVSLGPILAELLDASDTRVRVNAACSLARLDPGRSPDALWSRLLSEAECASRNGETRDLDRLVGAISRFDAREALAMQQRWAASPAERRLAILVAEAIGDPIVIPELIAWMDDDALARGAGRAFARITGIDLDYQDLVRAAPHDDDSGPSDDPDDERVELGSDHGLPWPSSIAVSRAWRAVEGMDSGTRYLEGRAIGVSRERGRANMSSMHEAALRELVVGGRVQHRFAAAAELGLWAPTLPLVEARAPASKPHRLPGWSAWLASEILTTNTESGALVSA